eukprot:4045646-Pleurochrysis_carterae.AAC.3
MYDQQRPVLRFEPGKPQPTLACAAEWRGGYEGTQEHHNDVHVQQVDAGECAWGAGGSKASRAHQPGPAAGAEVVWEEVLCGTERTTLQHGVGENRGVSGPDP